jgi:internalin A
MENIDVVLERVQRNKIIDSLNLSGRKIKILPSIIGELIHLKFLYLDENKLIFVPEIGNLVELVELSLEKNELTIIPESFVGLKALKSLNLSGNPLRCINDSLFINLQSLSILWLNNCGLMYLPPEIGLLRNLERLGLKENNLQELPDSIGQMTNIKWLSVEKNDIIMLPKSFKNLTMLGHLNASYNKIEKIPLFIYEMYCLNVLLLRKNHIKKIDDNDVIGMSTLQKVDLRDNPFITLIQSNNLEFYQQLLRLGNFQIKNDSLFL